MKSKLKLLILCFVAVAFASCGSTEAQDHLREKVEMTQAECPIRIADGITIDSIDYAHDMVTYHTSVTGDLIQLKTLREESDAIDRMIYEAIKSSDSPEIRSQLDMCKKADAKIVFVFYNPSGDTFDITIDPKEFEDSTSVTSDTPATTNTTSTEI